MIKWILELQHSCAGGCGAGAAGGAGSGLHDRKGEGGGDEGPAVCPAARAFSAARPAAAGHRLSPEGSGIARAAGRGRGREDRAGIPAGGRAAGAGICGDGGGAGGEAGTHRRGSRRGEPALAEAGEAVSPRPLRARAGEAGDVSQADRGDQPREGPRRRGCRAHFTRRLAALTPDGTECPSLPLYARSFTSRSPASAESPVATSSSATTPSCWA